MKFFLDSANIEDIKYIAETGLLDGITTNPTILSKENTTIESIIKNINEIAVVPLSIEVTETSYNGMLEQGTYFSKVADNVVIKLPLTREGLRVCYKLSSKGIKTNVTLCFSVAQALLAAKSGATYVSPFLGRLDDLSYCGMNLLKKIKNVFSLYHNFNTEIIAASIRSPLHCVDAAECGCDIVTLPMSVFSKLYNNPLTDQGIEKFLNDWNSRKELK